MSKVITFSRFFPAYHPRKGDPTYFVEKLWAGLADITDFTQPSLEMDWYEYYNGVPKWHTIRGGNRWKVGDKFSPRVWSGKPYASKQIIISPDIEIKKVLDFTCEPDGTFWINHQHIDVTSSDLPQNDGLSSDDFLNWFPENKPFSGQVICWNENINY